MRANAGAEGGFPVRIEAAGTRDVKAVLRLIEEAGWAYTRSEVERLMDVQPGGMLLARSRGLRPSVVGCVYASVWDHLGFIGLMLVRRSLQGRGLGRELMLASLELLQTRGATAVGLDAVQDVIGFYSKLGFRSRWQSLRLSLDTGRTEMPTPSLGVGRGGDAEVERAIELDRAVSGMDRATLLRRLHRDEDASLLVVPGEKEVLAFGVLRRSKGCVRLGPLVASGDDVGDLAAASLVATAMSETYPRVLTANVPSYNERSVDLFRSLGAMEQRPCLRMYRGDPGPADSPEGVWALGAAEKG